MSDHVGHGEELGFICRNCWGAGFQPQATLAPLPQACFWLSPLGMLLAGILLSIPTRAVQTRCRECGGSETLHLSRRVVFAVEDSVRCCQSRSA